MPSLTKLVAKKWIQAGFKNKTLGLKEVKKRHVTGRMFANPQQRDSFLKNIAKRKETEKAIEKAKAGLEESKKVAAALEKKHRVQLKKEAKRKVEQKSKPVAVSLSLWGKLTKHSLDLLEAGVPLIAKTRMFDGEIYQLIMSQVNHKSTEKAMYPYKRGGFIYVGHKEWPIWLDKQKNIDNIEVLVGNTLASEVQIVSFEQIKSLNNIKEKVRLASLPVRDDRNMYLMDEHIDYPFNKDCTNHKDMLGSPFSSNYIKENYNEGWCWIMVNIDHFKEQWDKLHKRPLLPLTKESIIKMVYGDKEYDESESFPVIMDQWSAWYEKNRFTVRVYDCKGKLIYSHIPIKRNKEYKHLYLRWQDFHVHKLTSSGYQLS